LYHKLWWKVGNRAVNAETEMEDRMNRSPQSSLAEAELVAPLERVSRTDVQSAGGKGANLSELVRAGFPVPAGFVVTTAAYDRFVTHSRLGETILRALREPSDSGATIRAAFEGAPIPPEVERNILAAYQQLGQGPVAVRSSATAEDLPEAAFAGQQDTYLNIVGPHALLDAVRRCWASLWADRAIAYRQRQGVDQPTVKLAVVVQRMVAAEAAGVMFSANPVTGARDEVVVDASPGLGEAVVSGLVTPDHFVLRKRRWGWSIAERRAGRREVIIRARSGGGTEHVEGTAASARHSPALPDWALHRLARLSSAIQRHFGGPQDVEWAWVDGKPCILQARPITALPEPPPHANRLQRMLASNFGEMMRIRPYPLDMATWLPALAGAVEPLLGLLGLDWSLNRMFEAEDAVVVRLSATLPRPTWKTLLAPVRLVSLMVRYNPLRWQSDPLLAETHARLRDLESREVRALSWEELLATVHAAREIPFLTAGELRRRYFPRAAFALMRLRLLLGLLGHASQLGILLSGAANKTLEANHALEQLAQTVRSDLNLANTFSTHTPEALWSALEARPAGRAFLVELQAFFDRYGHRETMISTALQPTWKDAPEVVLGMIKSFAAHPAQLQTGTPAWQVARDELLQHPLRVAPLRSAFLQILAQARALLQIREDTHFYATLSLPLFRRTLLECGRRLVGAGVLGTAEDVFHLKLDELERIEDKLPPRSDLAAELRASMLRRKNARARLEGTPLIDPRLFPNSSSKGDELLRGMPGSPGVAEGPARIVRDGFEFDKLVPGDVLVAPYTNPSWTPLFQRAIAVVVDSGSAASHAAIVAREYGIPAVMSTVMGTRTLRDGERICVDGSQGAVFRVTPETAEHEGQELMD
jgi:phosphohistidine swiveling domain-containing protein